MTIAKLITGIFFILIFNMVYAQEDVSKYFDDGGISEANKIIKVGYDPFNGEKLIMFEHEIIRNLSLEWGAGLISIERQNKRYSGDPIPDLPESGLGYTAWINPRVYLRGYYERLYIGIKPKLSIMNGKKYWDIVFFDLGYQIPIYNTWVIDLNAGLGVRFFKKSMVITTVEYIENDTRAYFPIQIKIGYAF